MIIQEYEANGQRVEVILENGQLYILWNGEVGSRKVRRSNADKLTGTWQMYLAMANLS